MIRVAAVGDVHLAADACGHLRPALVELPEVADVLLLAGDLTRHGTVEEAECVAVEFGDLGVPVVAVLGNHDYHCDQQDRVAEVLRGAGLTVLEGDSTVVRTGAERLGVAGVKGFGLGFAGRSCSNFGEPECKAFARHGKAVAARLGAALDGLADRCDRVVALTHYSPVPDTLVGEPPEIYAFLGNYLLAEAIDGARVDLAVHGHAHAGTEKGVTAGGTRVRNVAQPVLRRAYAVYDL
ncbi:MAG: metallophosphoesterase [Mycobacteriales bacterium]